MTDKCKNTDELIGKLCNELKPVKHCCPYRKIVPWFVLSAVYLIATVLFLGLRPDLVSRLEDSIFIFETGLGLSIFLSAAMASSWLSFPDCRQQQWIRVIPSTLFGVLLFWVAVRCMEEGLGAFGSLHFGHCAHEGLLMEAIPLVALIIITMRGRTTHPYWSMFMNILAVATLGWIGLRLTCSMDDMCHSLVNHLLPFAVLSALLGFFARKLFKW